MNITQIKSPKNTKTGRALATALNLGLAAVLALTSSVSFAGDRHHHDSRDYHRGGSHWSSHQSERRYYDSRNRHYDSHHSHYRSYKHRHNNLAEVVVGGLVLGAVINELAKDNSAGNYTRYTYPPASTSTTTTTRVYRSEVASEEFLLDRDGRCFAIEYSGDRKILTEVPTSSCGS